MNAKKNVILQIAAGMNPGGKIYNVVMLLLFLSLISLPAYAQGGAPGTDGLNNLAQSIQTFMIQALVIAGPVSILLGFGMIFFGGFNPQWKQRGIEVIKWTVIGAIGVGLIATGLWAFIQSSSGLGSGGGG